MTHKRQFTEGMDIVLLGYRGDRMARDVKVEKVVPGKIVAWDKNRRVYRSYFFKLIDGIRRVKV